jgi:hypothetical protein
MGVVMELMTKTVTALKEGRDLRTGMLSLYSWGLSMLLAFIDLSLMHTKVNLVDIVLPQSVDHSLIASFLCNIISKMRLLPFSSTDCASIHISPYRDTVHQSSRPDDLDRHHSA